MQQKQFKSKLHLLSLLLCIVLIAAMALCTVGCNDDQDPNGGAEDVTTTTVASTAEIKGEGNTVFYFHVIDPSGEKSEFEIHTDKVMVGEALQELELIQGEEGMYGIYVKVVNGISLDYNRDGKYWAFYVNDTYSMSGADVTEIVPGTTYSFRAE